MIGETQIYAAAVEKWGERSQVNMALEELAECSLAINKLFNRDWSMNRLIELSSEIADVQIVLEQIKYMLQQRRIHDLLPPGCSGMDFDTMVENQYNYKLARLAGRVGLTEPNE